MKSTFGAAFAVALLSACAFAQAADVTSITLEPAGPAIRAAGASVQPTYRALAAEQRQLSVESTKELLTSAEGSAWRVTAVEAPSCEKAELTQLRRQHKKVEVKECLQKQADCAKATKFSALHKAHAACSPLYTLTTVLLTTRVGGVK